MPISLIVGPPNSGRANAIRCRLEESLDADPVLVVPTGDDVAWFERELSGQGRAVLGATICTFRRLTDEVATTTEANLRKPLADAERLALVRASTRHPGLRALRGAAAHQGFAPALERLIAELQAALIGPEELARAAAEIDDGGHESELAALYAAYVERREEAGRDDSHSATRKVAASLRARPDAWGRRPVLVYGFDDLTEEQFDLLAALSGACQVTVAVNYADTEALAARAGLLARLRSELGAVEVEKLRFDPGYTPSATLRELDQHLFEVGGARIEPDGGLALLECGGERGEVEAIGGEIARLLADGVKPDEIVIVTRHPDRRGPLYRQVLAGFGVPVAVEAAIPLSRTAVGRGTLALARCALQSAPAGDLLDFLRAQPGAKAQGIADWVERLIRRGRARTADEVLDGWSAPPASLAALRAAG
ncbi:MAG TPA: hypothetical protein VH391_07045, partial [Solirubrobacterales bacterium]